MKSDVLRWLSGHPGRKRPSKETLNHPELIELASGLNVRHDTADAYRLAYEALGIDIINIVPESNTPPALAPGQVATRANERVQTSYLGVYDSSCRVHFPFQTTEAFWLADTEAITYDQLDLPGAQYLMSCTSESITRKSELIGEVGLYYYQLYTTLFMWGVEALGWEIFMLAATEDPQRFDAHFLKPMFEKSKKIVEMLSDLSAPWVFCHDDIATATGAVFHPDWYRRYIYPRYEKLWSIAHARGKKVFFVADGNLDWALEDLRETGCDGLMFETPATDLSRVLDVWDDRFVVGGINAELLTNATADMVRGHVADVAHATADHVGFALCCSGGLVGNMPLENLEAYFDARVEYGFTSRHWR